MSTTTGFSKSPSNFAQRLYRDWLARLETWIVLVLLGLVVIYGILSVFGPHLGYRYSVEAREHMKLAAFYLCMFGAVLATRRASNIAVDAVTPHLAKHIRLRVEGALMLFSAAVTFFVGIEAWKYVSGDIIPDELVTWRWQIGLVFVWIGLHFAVNGLVRLFGKDMVELGLAYPPEERDFDVGEEIDDESDSESTPDSDPDFDPALGGDA